MRRARGGRARGRRVRCGAGRRRRRPRASARRPPDPSGRVDRRAPADVARTPSAGDRRGAGTRACRAGRPLARTLLAVVALTPPSARKMSGSSTIRTSPRNASSATCSQSKPSTLRSGESCRDDAARHERVRSSCCRGPGRRRRSSGARGRRVGPRRARPADRHPPRGRGACSARARARRSARRGGRRARRARLHAARREPVVVGSSNEVARRRAAPPSQIGDNAERCSAWRTTRTRSSARTRWR